MDSQWPPKAHKTMFAIDESARNRFLPQAKKYKEDHAMATADDMYLGLDRPLNPKFRFEDDSDDVDERGDLNEQDARHTHFLARASRNAMRKEYRDNPMGSAVIKDDWQRMWFVDDHDIDKDEPYNLNIYNN